MPEFTKPVLTFPSDELVKIKSSYEDADIILEYGSGGSTVFASELSDKTIFTVESDKAWADNLRNYIAHSEQTKSDVLIHHADIGPTVEWGHPSDMTQWAKFSGFATSVWNLPGFKNPDLVLIDGRFRISCFYAVLLMTKKPVTVLVDDYYDRPKYDVIEKLGFEPKPFGRMAEFELPASPLEISDLQAFISSFYSAH